MKKIFLLFTMTACLFSLQAQESNVWTDKFALPREAKDAANNDLVSVATDKSVYATGLFTEGFSFGSFDLEPIATSTYLVKYDAEGNKKWAVAFAGAATPTAITVAEDGSVYVAGTLADEVIFGSTDDATQTKEGTKLEDGTFSTYQSAAFIAQYTAEGVLENVQTYIPQAYDPSVFEEYYSEDGIRILINSIQKTSDKLFASILIRGKYLNSDVEIKGSYINYFDVLFYNLYGANVVSFDSSLQMKSVYASLRAKEGLDADNEPRSLAFVVNSDELLVGFSALGSLELETDTQKETITFSSAIVGGDTHLSKGFILVRIDIPSKKLLANEKFEYAPNANLRDNNKVASLNMVNADLVVIGRFQNELPFNNSIVAVGDGDTYIAVLSPSDLSVKSAVSSAQAGTEIVTGTAIIGDNVFISSIIDKKSNLYSYNLKDNQATNSAIEGYLNSMAANGDGLASITVPLDGETAELVVKLDKYDQGSGIENNWDNAINVTAYPNPVVDQLFFSESCDVYVYNNIGVLVVSKKDATSINVESLTNGVYFAVVTTPNGKQTIPFVKK